MEDKTEQKGDPESRKATSAPESKETAPREKQKKKFEIDIFKGWCKSCGICAAFCPRECISIDADGSPVVTDSDRCTGCGWCELHCPDFAISVRAAKKKRVQEQED